MASQKLYFFINKTDLFERSTISSLVHMAFTAPSTATIRLKTIDITRSIDMQEHTNGMY